MHHKTYLYKTFKYMPNIDNTMMEKCHTQQISVVSLTAMSSLSIISVTQATQSCSCEPSVDVRDRLHFVSCLECILS